MSIQEFEEKLAAIREETLALQSQRPDLLVVFGEKALPVLHDKKEFAALASEIDELDDKIEELKKDEEELLDKKQQYEKEEKEQFLRRTCSQCKILKPEGAKFCEECGTPIGVLPVEYCETCGTVNYEGQKFCGECGAKLTD